MYISGYIQVNNSIIKQIDPVAGTFPDWVHEHSKVKLIFNPELRPAKEMGLKGLVGVVIKS